MEIGTANPDPRNLVSCDVSNVLQSILHFSKPVIWGSSWGRGFPFHWLGPHLVQHGRRGLREGPALGGDLEPAGGHAGAPPPA